MEEQTLLCHNCGVYGVHVKAPSVKRADTCVGLSPTKHFRGGVTIMYKYGILLFSDAVTLLDRIETYGEGVIVRARTYS